LIIQIEHNAMAAHDPQGPTPAEWSIVNNMISERSAGFPPRVLQELTRVRPALEKLVEAKVPFREINDRFAKTMQIKISAALFRKYMKQEFGYPPGPGGKSPPAPAAAPAARKSTKKASRKAKP
jgi:hypothetical protein